MRPRTLALVTFLAALGFTACHDEDDGVGSACKQDSDCAANLECEVEHGQGFCKEHGGGEDDEDGDDDTDTGDTGEDTAHSGTH